VPGLVVQPDYVTPEEERALLAHVDAGEWSSDFKRRVQVFGLGYGGGDDDVAPPEGDERLRGLALLQRRRLLADDDATWVRDLPPWLDGLARRLVADGHLLRYPENAVINDYAPGVGIAPHRDYSPFGSTIAAVSLGSDVVLRFESARGGEKVDVVAPARSLWAVRGAARWQWRHGIAARLSDVIDGVRKKRGRRVSITLRVARKGPLPAVVDGRLVDAG
jgi:alkylated DNA repair dioxygenase AlkB